MKWVSSSELKAKLAEYLRLVRRGEVVEVRDRGIAIATLRGIEKQKGFETIPPLKKPSGLGKMVSEVDSPPKTDIVDFLMKDRRGQ